jgi:hypothetical protein
MRDHGRLSAQATSVAGLSSPDQQQRNHDRRQGTQRQPMRHPSNLITGREPGQLLRQIYQEGLWTCGRSALPTGCASPASRANSESRETLAFAHIPTGTTTNNGFDIDRVNGGFVEPVAPVTAIGADIETGRVTP